MRSWLDELVARRTTYYSDTFGESVNHFEFSEAEVADSYDDSVGCHDWLNRRNSSPRAS